MIKSLIATTQVIFGYLLFAAILDLILPEHTGNIKIVIFSAFLAFIRLAEHPTNYYNPFAFSLGFRTWVYFLLGGGYDESDPIDRI